VLVSEGESGKEMSPGAGDKGAVVVGSDPVGMPLLPFTPVILPRSSQKDSVSGRGLSPIFELTIP
jgi:hypothetical protein